MNVFFCDTDEETLAEVLAEGKFPNVAGDWFKVLDERLQSRRSLNPHADITIADPAADAYEQGLEQMRLLAEQAENVIPPTVKLPAPINATRPRRVKGVHPRQSFAPRMFKSRPRREDWSGEEVPSYANEGWAPKAIAKKVNELEQQTKTNAAGKVVIMKGDKELVVPPEIAANLLNVFADVGSVDPAKFDEATAKRMVSALVQGDADWVTEHATEVEAQSLIVGGGHQVLWHDLQDMVASGQTNYIPKFLRNNPRFHTFLADQLRAMPPELRQAPPPAAAPVAPTVAPAAPASSTPLQPAGGTRRAGGGLAGVAGANAALTGVTPTNPTSVTAPQGGQIASGLPAPQKTMWRVHAEAGKEVKQLVTQSNARWPLDKAESLRRAIRHMERWGRQQQRQPDSVTIDDLFHRHYSLGLLHLWLSRAEWAERPYWKDSPDELLRDMWPFWRALTDGMDDSRTKHTRLAVTHFKAAATLHDQSKVLPTAHASMRTGFALLCLVSRFDTEPADEALQYFEQAERLFACSGARMEQIRARDGLALAHLCLAIREADTAERAAHLESAQMSVAQAYLLATPESSSVSQARSALLLGDAYRNLPGGVSIVNTCAAIERYEEGLEACIRVPSPLDYVELHHRLGLAYQELIDAKVLETSWFRLLESLQEPKLGGSPVSGGDPRAWTAEQREEGLNRAEIISQIWGHWPCAEEETLLQRAAGCFENALTACSPSCMPFLYAQVQFDLGKFYWYRGPNMSHDREAIACYRQALAVYTPDAAPLKNQEVQSCIKEIKDAFAQFAGEQREDAEENDFDGEQREDAEENDFDSLAREWDYESGEAYDHTGVEFKMTNMIADDTWQQAAPMFMRKPAGIEVRDTGILKADGTELTMVVLGEREWNLMMTGRQQYADAFDCDGETYIKLTFGFDKITEKIYGLAGDDPYEHVYKIQTRRGVVYGMPLDQGIAPENFLPDSNVLRTEELTLADGTKVLRPARSFVRQLLDDESFTVEPTNSYERGIVGLGCLFQSDRYWIASGTLWKIATEFTVANAALLPNIEGFDSHIIEALAWIASAPASNNQLVMLYNGKAEAPFAYCPGQKLHLWSWWMEQMEKNTDRLAKGEPAAQIAYVPARVGSGQVTYNRA